MITKIKNIEGLKGKTIADFKLNCGDLYLKFTDNTFCVLKVNDITEGYGYAKHEVNIDDYDTDLTDHTLVVLGLLSEKDYNDACSK